jgi:dihydroneopterin aldolase
MKDVNIIRIKNATFYAFHGVADGEQDLGGKYEVDMEAYLNFKEAAKHDILEKTVSYEDAYNFIKDTVCQYKFKLIETVCYNIVELLFEEFTCIERLQVRVRKYTPPLKGVVDFVEAEVIRDR